MGRMDAARAASLTPPERFFRKAKAKIGAGHYEFDVDAMSSSRADFLKIVIDSIPTLNLGHKVRPEMKCLGKNCLFKAIKEIARFGYFEILAIQLS